MVTGAAALGRRFASRILILMLVGASVPGCTVFSVAISPITGPVDAVRAAVEGDLPAAKVWVVPFLIILSPVAGLVAGLLVDEGVVTEGRWDAIPAIPAALDDHGKQRLAAVLRRTSW